MRVFHFYATLFLFFATRAFLFVLPLFIFSLTCLFSSLAQERPYYESRLNVEQKTFGSNLILCRSKGISVTTTLDNTTTPEPLFFEFKRRAYGTLASNVAASWLGIGQKQFRRSTLDGASVLAAQQLSDTSCAVLLERRDTLFVGEVSAQLQVLKAVRIPLSSSASASILTSATNGDGVRVLVLGAGRSVAITIAGRLFWWNCSQRSNASINTDSSASASIRAIEEYTVNDMVTLNEYTESPNDPACALLRESGVRKDVLMLSYTGQELWSESLDVQRRTTLRRVSNYTVAACVEQGLTTSINIIHQKKQMLTTGINAASALISFAEEPTRISVVALTQDNLTGKYQWEVVRMPFGAATYSEILWTFPENVFVPISVTAVGNEFWCVFMNALYVMNALHEPIATGRMNTRLQTTSDNTNHHALVRESSNHGLYAVVLGRETLLVSRERIPLWWLRNIIRDVWLYAVLLAVIGIVLALLYIVRYQRRLLITLFGVPGADTMIILDDEGKLQSLNESARALLRVAQEAPMRRLFQFYCVDAGALALSTFARETLKLRTQSTKPITFQRPLTLGENTVTFEGLPETEPHDYLFTAIPIQTRFGAMRGLMLTGKDITEELGKKKLGNWAQLAHDLQTNLAAIRLNAEKITTSNMSAEGQKILYQVNLIIKRVRDIITIGKSEDLEKRVADAADVCANVRKEFDDALFANVGFEVHAQHILFECDQLKLERALRNAVENGIRAMPDSDGVISIRAWFEAGVVCFQVRDTGEGMSVDVQKNMMRKGFTTFGSQGGSGMGTMIMKYIVQLHGGEMLIQSEKGKGTAVQFRIPARSAKHLHHLKPLEISGNELMSE